MLENANTRKIYAVSPAIYYKDKTLTVYYAVSYYEIPKAIYLTIQVINNDGLIVAHKNIDQIGRASCRKRVLRLV